MYIFHFAEQELETIKSVTNILSKKQFGVQNRPPPPSQRIHPCIRLVYNILYNILSGFRYNQSGSLDWKLSLFLVYIDIYTLYIIVFFITVTLCTCNWR